MHFQLDKSNNSDKITLDENFRKSQKEYLTTKRFDELTKDDIIYVTNGNYDCCLGKYLSGSITTDKDGRTMYNVDVEVIYPLNPHYDNVSTTNQVTYSDTFEVYIGDLDSKLNTGSALMSSSLIDELKNNFGVDFNKKPICREICEFIHNKFPDTEIAETRLFIHNFGDKVLISNTHFVIKYEDKLYDFTNQQYSDYDEYMNWMEKKLPMVFTYNNFFKFYWCKEDSYVNYPVIEVKSINEDYNTDSVDDDIANEGEETAADNNGAVVESLQVAVKQKQELENKVLDLQEKLSVSYAKETRLEEQIVKYSKAISNLSNTSKKVTALQEKINSLTEELNKEKEHSQQLNGKISRFENISKKERGLKESLKEQVSDRDIEISKLNESIEQITEAKNSMQNDNMKLLEQISTLKKDSALKKTEYSQKLEQSNKLVEKYKKIANKAVEQYIELQADRIGVNAKEIQNKLPESYTFQDIDSICEDLQSYKLTLNKLPFSTAKSLNENLRMNVTSSKNESILPGETFNADDEIDEMLKSLL